MHCGSWLGLCTVMAAAVAAAAASHSQNPLLAAQGCGQRLPAVSKHTIQSDGTTRTYLVFVPPDYAPDSPAPVILSFHGGGETADDQLALDQFTSPSFNTEALVVYPEGIKETWQGVPGVDTNDVQFTADLLDRLEERYCVDPARIFVSGKSDGGGFAGVLACDGVLSARIAAFAPVSGAFYVDAPPPCDAIAVDVPCRPARAAVPVLEFHGGADHTIPYAGGPRKGQCLPAVPNWVRQWALRDGLGPDNVTTPLGDGAFQYRFGHGDSDGLVSHIFDKSIGHDWPSTVPNGDNQRSGHVLAAFNATPIILDFFQTHPLY